MKIYTGFNGVQWRIALAVVAGIATLVPSLLAASPIPCCFSNDRYEGICKVIPDEGETCQSILAYLNNPMSTGRSYCGGSSVRNGWILVDCKTGKSVTRKQGKQGVGPAQTGYFQRSCFKEAAEPEAKTGF